MLASRDTPASTSRKSDSEPPRKAVSEKRTIFVHFSRKTEIAKCAREPRLQGPSAESALVMQHFGQKTLVT